MRIKKKPDNLPAPALNSNTSKHMKRNQPLKILYLPLEFASWDRGRSWTYATQLGLEEGFAANGVEFTTVPAFSEMPGAQAEGWCRMLERICNATSFDQVWFELVHTAMTPRIRDFLSQIAPVRVGLVAESLSYSEDIYKQYPQFVGRREKVLERVSQVTHVICVDEYDAADIDRNTAAHACWFVPAVPQRCVHLPHPVDPAMPALFTGSFYGVRSQWLELQELKGLLQHAVSPENSSNYPHIFNEMNAVAVDLLKQPQTVNPDAWFALTDGLRSIRRKSFDLWQDGLRQGCAVVNLPHFVQTYAGRVVEAMAAGMPVISWEIPDRPQNRELFSPGEEILLFDQNDPAQLGEHVKWARSHTSEAYELALRAQKRVLQFHTVEKRVAQVMQWIEHGIEPLYRTPEHDNNEPLASVHLFRDIVLQKPVIANAPKPNAASSAKAESDAFYSRLFKENSQWSTLQPNAEETARWKKISAFLNIVVPDAQTSKDSIRIIEVGCGRGWLSNLLSFYGDVEGVEPVEAVSHAAQSNFPQLRFTAGTAESILQRNGFSPFDTVVSSEVIEHVPYADQPRFVFQIRDLLKPGGYAIITTPRKEVVTTWLEIVNNFKQPVEDWVTEEQLESLFTQAGFHTISRSRILFDRRTFTYPEHASPDLASEDIVFPLYQVWLFRRGA